MTPPEKLRAELERLRARGYSFSMAWPAAVSAALRDEPVHHAVFWRLCWQAEQRELWATAYSRQPWPANERPGLEPIGTHDASSSARPSRALVLA